MKGRGREAREKRASHMPRSLYLRPVSSVRVQRLASSHPELVPASRVQCHTRLVAQRDVEPLHRITAGNIVRCYYDYNSTLCKWECAEEVLADT